MPLMTRQRNWRGWRDQLAGDEMKENNIAGLSVTIVVNKQVAVSRAYGMADAENHVPVSTATRFRSGSIAKPITAAAAMALYQSGRLDLDAPVQEYCPAFPRKHWTITTRELLGHLAGIRHYRDDQSDLYSAKHYTDVRGGFELFAGDPLLFQPGTRTLYSTYGYSVVGCVIEGASGEEFRGGVERAGAGAREDALDAPGQCA
jgi:CubicO group peptidase (beta-lactamase class C family)